MNPQANIQKIKTLYDSFAQGDIATILASVGDNFDWTDSGAPHVPYAGHYLGRDNFSTFFEKMNAAGQVSKWAVNSVEAVGETIVARGEFGIRSHQTGKTGETDWVMVWDFDGNVPMRGKSFLDTAAIAEAFR